MNDTRTTAPVRTPHEALEHLLRELIDRHEKLLAQIGAHRDAIASADRDALQACIEGEHLLIQEIADLEAERRRVVGELSGAKVASVLTMPQAAAHVPEPTRTRVLDLANRLKGIIENLNRQQRVVRDATVSLLGHMEGVMRQVSARLSHAGTYSSRGQVESGAQQIVSALDLTH